MKLTPEMEQGFDALERPERAVILGLTIRAENSSGSQRLHIDRGPDGTFDMTLLGIYNGEEVQIDFDPLTPEDIREVIDFLEIKVSRGSLS